MACDDYLISYTGFDNSLGDVDSIIYQPFLYYRLLCANEVSFVLLKGVVDVHLLQSIELRPNWKHFAVSKQIDAGLRASFDNSLLILAFG